MATTRCTVRRGGGDVSVSFVRALQPASTGCLPKRHGEALPGLSIASAVLRPRASQDSKCHPCPDTSSVTDVLMRNCHPCPETSQATTGTTVPTNSKAKTSQKKMLLGPRCATARPTL